MPASLPSLPPPSKRRKIQNSSPKVKNIQKFEQDLTYAVTNDASLNPLADLIHVARTTEDAQITSKAIYAIYRIFVLIITNDKLGLGGDEAAKAVKAWLLDRLNEYTDFLGGLLKDEEKTLRTSALQILFSLQKHLSTSYSKTSLSSSPQPQFHISHFRKIVSSLLLCLPSSRPSQPSSNEPNTIINADILNQFYETWFSVYDDIRWFFLRESTSLLLKCPAQAHPNIATNILSIIERLTTFPTEQSELNAWWVSEMGAKPPKPKFAKKNGDNSDEEEERPKMDGEEEDDDWRKFFEDEPAPTDMKKSNGMRIHQMTIHQSLHSLSSHRAVFTRTWLTLLPRLVFEDDTGKSKALAIRVLNIMHRAVMPHLTRPVLVMDWVGACVDYGGSVGLLALNALFILMKDYNLDYPSFYTRLYAFLDRDVLHLKHRARFFRLTELFLSSTHLPATLLASFIKRLSRLSLTAPPAAIVMVIPFTYNILKLHPALMVMIHRTDIDGDSIDPYISNEPNPMITNALESSLWELMSHRTHYHASVSTLCKIFSEAFTKPGYSMEDFLDHSYTTLFDTEAKRKIKKEPALAVDIGKNPNLFPVTLPGQKDDEEDAKSEELPVGDVVQELWSFA